MNYSEMTDIELWSRFKSGDDTALSVIYAAHSKKLYLYGLKFTPENTLVEDAIQDLFTELIKNRQSLGSTDNIAFYLLKSVKRKLLRKMVNERHFNFGKTPDYSFDVTYSVELDIITEEISRQKKSMLVQALQDLSPRQKEAIYLRFSKELNYAELAEIMNISVEAGRNLISGAIKRMKEAIDSRGKNQIILFVKLFLKKS